MTETEAEFKHQPVKCKYCSYIVVMGGSFFRHLVCEHYNEYLNKVFFTMPDETQKQLLDKVWDQFE